MTAILRFNGAVRRDPAIDQWIAGCPEEFRPAVQHWFTRMRQCGPDVVELMHDGCPVACIGDVPFGYVNAFRKHVNVGFFNGANLDDPEGLLQGEGRNMRHVKLKPGETIDTLALAALIDAAYEDCRRRSRP